jgi:hypothetical protein
VERSAALWGMLLAAVLTGSVDAEPMGPAGGRSMSAGAGGSLLPQQPPEQVARGHLKRARDWCAAADEMAKAKCDPRLVDAYYAAAEEAWNAVWSCPGSHEILCEASMLYADAVAGLLETASCHGRLTEQGLLVGPGWRPTCVPIQTRGLPFEASSIVRLVAKPPPGDARIARRHVRGGFGLPVVVRLADAPTEEQSALFTPQRQSVAATAVLRFRMPGDENFLQKFAGPLARDPAAAVLDLANPVEIAAVNVGPARPLLAADLSSPLLDMLSASPRSNIAGFLQPYGRGDTQPRLEFLEPHQRGRIPVVFIHGLASDEGTWFDMINELRTWPTFHKRFEAWVYHYPTGANFLQSSAVIRQNLEAAVRRLDPAGTDPALRSMVLIGHSMGGLHAKLQVVDPGTKLWDAVSYMPFEQIRARPELKRQVMPYYFFKPLPFVKRVVFIATPHDGSSWASRGIGQIASLAVQQPSDSKAIHDEVVRMNPDAFHGDYARSLPTTIDVLEPESTILRAIRGLRTACWVTTHSVIGDPHPQLPVTQGDCVVPVSSARHPGAVSEVVVPATHNRIHHEPATITEITRILAEHLSETDSR